MKPNIVVFLLDAARADHLSVYGYERDTTPFLKKIAKQGTVYEKAYSNSIWSLPSYGSIFTGMYPSEHGGVDWGSKIPNNVLVENISKNGYTSCAISPHLISGEFGIADAFDTTFWVNNKDVLIEPDPVVTKIQNKRQSGGWDKGLQKYIDILRWTSQENSYETLLNGLYYLLQETKKKLGFWNDNGANEVLNKGIKFASSTQEPFFLFMNFIETHGPYIPPKNFVNEYIDERYSKSKIRKIGELNTIELSAGETDLSAKDNNILVSLYDAEISYLDQKFEEFYNRYQNLNINNETIFLFLSDHGDLFGEEGFWGHQGIIHPKLCRVPLIVKYPWEKNNNITETVELRGLNNHLISLSNGCRETLSTSNKAFIEYYGWDTQLLIKPWEKYEQINETDAKRYQSAITRDDQFLVWDSEGSSRFYEDGEREDLAHPLDLKNELEKNIGHPNKLYNKYRSEKRDGFGLSKEVSDRLEDLGYTY